MAPDIKGNLDAFLCRRSPAARYASFDYCFNYFQDARDAQETADLASGGRLELSCLHLGFYLASWGMMRGSGGLHGRSLHELVPVVQVIADEPPGAWELDVPGYSEAGIAAVLALGDRIRSAYTFAASPVLVTKTMLGIFGCIPAFDRFFRLGFGRAVLDRATLTKISDFYTANKSALHAAPVRTLDFGTGAGHTPPLHPGEDHRHDLLPGRLQAGRKSAALTRRTARCSPPASRTGLFLAGWGLPAAFAFILLLRRCGDIMDPFTTAVIGWAANQAGSAGVQGVRRLLGDKQRASLRKVVRAAVESAAGELAADGDRAMVREALLAGSVVADAGGKDLLDLRDAIARQVGPSLVVLRQQRGSRPMRRVAGC